MAGTTADFLSLANPDNIAVEISNRYKDWDTARAKKVKQWNELRDYVYAVDTTTTSNALLPWSNTTTTPKLTQIFDNLHANYFATLFPQRRWLKWEGSNLLSNAKEVQNTMSGFMLAKLNQQGFENEISTALVDYILYGNVFLHVDYESRVDQKEDGALAAQYIGPKIRRISPYDIVFNPLAPDFKSAPKIVRSVFSVGEIARLAKQDPDWVEPYNKIARNRAYVLNGQAGPWSKMKGFTADGFSNIRQYYESGHVEVLTFYGDMYNTHTGELEINRIITVIDRMYVVSSKENPSWIGHAPIFHASWRQRPDNLWGMGPLDNLVGLQYNIDHVENMKMDALDQVVYPIVKVSGDVEEFDFAPGARIYTGVDGDVSFLSANPAALQVNYEMDRKLNLMEEMAGAPRQAMGIRTPGEKTAFEVQTLDNYGSRIFQHKCAHLERVLLEPAINCAAEFSRRLMDTSDVVRVVGDKSGAVFFREIKPEDLTADGKLTCIGARHFAERNRRLQQLQQLQLIKQDQTVAPHISGKKIAQIFAEELEEPTLYAENIAVTEAMETQSAAQDAEIENQEELANKANMGL